MNLQHHKKKKKIEFVFIKKYQCKKNERGKYLSGHKILSTRFLFFKKLNKFIEILHVWVTDMLFPTFNLFELSTQ